MHARVRDGPVLDRSRAEFDLEVGKTSHKEFTMMSGLIMILSCISVSIQTPIKSMHAFARNKSSVLAPGM